nr:hypothetical protein [Pseudomonas sp. WS 5027]
MESTIAGLVTAANNLTNVVSGKMAGINAALADALVKFDEWRSLKDTVGDPYSDGTLTMSIFQGQVWGTGGPIEPQASGGFVPTNLGKTTDVYFHFKLPLNVNRDDRMFWLNLRGYSYGSSKVVDETVAGYAYSAQRALISTNAVGNMTPSVYVDDNGNVVVRIFCPNAYITAIRIDSMKVGIGPSIKQGEIVTKLSLAEKVVF